MAFKDIMQKMQGVVDKASARREDGQRVPQNTMPNGSVSGYVPPPASRFAGTRGGAPGRTRSARENQAVEIPQLQPSMPDQPVARSAGAQSSAGDQPYGNQTTSQPMPPARESSIGSLFRLRRERKQRAAEAAQAGNDAAAQPPVQDRSGAAPQQNYPNGAPQQGYTNSVPQQGYTNNVPPQGYAGSVPQQGYTNNVPPQGYANGNQPPVNAGYNGRHATPEGGYPQQSMYGQQNPNMQPPVNNMPPQPPVNNAVPQPPVNSVPQQDNVVFFNTRPDEQGNTYALTLNMVQITSVASCYRLLEYMQQDEMVIVNAEQITDSVEASRCIDMLCGAAIAMKMNLERISGKTIYLIAPLRVKLTASDGMHSLNEADRMNRWPGSSRARGQEPRQEAYQSGYDRRPPMQRQPQYADRGGYGSSGGRY